MCECDVELKEGYMTHKGILRRTLRCLKCGELQDYYPQYESDDIKY